MTDIVNRRALTLAQAKMSPRARSGPAQAVALLELTASQKDRSYTVATQEIACWFIDRGSPDLLVTFAPSGSGQHPTSQWGEALGAQLGWSQVGVETTGPNWFPEDDIETCLTNSLEVILQRFMRITTLGVSQGGFAALRYGKRIGAKNVVSVSPQYSIDQDVIKDPRFAPYYKSALHSGRYISSEGSGSRPYLIFDPYDKFDAAHVARTKRDLATNDLKLPFFGHGCSALVGNTVVMSGIIISVTRGDLAGAAQQARLRRRSNSKRAFLIALECSNRHPAIALRILQQAELRDGEWMHVCYRLAKRGFAKEALPFVLEIASSCNDDPEAQATAELVGSDAGEVSLALTHAYRAVALAPRNPRYRHILHSISGTTD